MPEIRHRRRKKRIIQICLINNSILYYVLSQIFSPPNDVRSKIYVFNSLGITSNGRSDDIRSINFVGTLFSAVFGWKPFAQLINKNMRKQTKAPIWDICPFSTTPMFTLNSIYSLYISTFLYSWLIYTDTHAPANVQRQKQKINKHFSSQLISQYVCCESM